MAGRATQGGGVKADSAQEFQDQGSLDQPAQSTEPTPLAENQVGTLDRIEDDKPEGYVPPEEGPVNPVLGLTQEQEQEAEERPNYVEQQGGTPGGTGATAGAGGR